MTLHIFPLQMVAFPHEEVPLHIFEPRYRVLMAHCEATGDPFGLTPVHEGKVVRAGTALHLHAVAKRYDDGRLDVVCRGSYTFTVRRFLPEPSEQTAHRAEITPLAGDDTADAMLAERVLAQYKKFHELIRTFHVPAIRTGVPLSFQLAHTCGLPTAGKIQLLELDSENHRLQLLAMHLQKLIPTVEEIEQTRAKIRQNGHYRVLPGGDFKFE
jgi:Lon protease-like protein